MFQIFLSLLVLILMTMSRSASSQRHHGRHLRGVGRRGGISGHRQPGSGWDRHRDLRKGTTRAPAFTLQKCQTSRVLSRAAVNFLTSLQQRHVSRKDFYLLLPCKCAAAATRWGSPSALPAAPCTAAAAWLPICRVSGSPCGPSWVITPHNALPTPQIVQ